MECVVFFVLSARINLSKPLAIQQLRMSGDFGTTYAGMLSAFRHVSMLCYFYLEMRMML